MAGFSILWNLEILFSEISERKNETFQSESPFAIKLIRSLMFINLTACVMCISAAPHSMIVAFSAQFTGPNPEPHQGAG